MKQIFASTVISDLHLEKAVFAIVSLIALTTFSSAQVTHPVLTGNFGYGNNAAAQAIINANSDSAYVSNFVPLGPPRDPVDVPSPVPGDTGWSWSATTPNQITSTPSGQVFPNNATYPEYTESLQVLSGNTIQASYWNAHSGSPTPQTFVRMAIDNYKFGQIDSDLPTLAQAYYRTGWANNTPAMQTATYYNSSNGTTGQLYSFARRIAVILDALATPAPNYPLTQANYCIYEPATPSFQMTTTQPVQRQSTYNGLAHEWTYNEVMAFDAIVGSPALADLSTQRGYNVAQNIADNYFGAEGNFLTQNVPAGVASQFNLPEPYFVLPSVAQAIQDSANGTTVVPSSWISYNNSYMSAAILHLDRDNVDAEGLAYSYNYLGSLAAVAQDTLAYFNTWPANTPALIATQSACTANENYFNYGSDVWDSIRTPDGVLPAFGDTPYAVEVTPSNAGSSAVVASYGHVSMGAGTGTQAVQVNQNFPGTGNHMKSDITAFVLWAFGAQPVDNMRYFNGSPFRGWTEQLLEHNSVVIDRTDPMVAGIPNTSTYGNGNLTMYEPGNNGFAVTEIDGQRYYHAQASRYQRIMILNTADLTRPYVVDVFRVTGGQTHDYVRHGAINYSMTGTTTLAVTPMSGANPLLEGSEIGTYNATSGTPYYGNFVNMSSGAIGSNFNFTYQDTSTAHHDVRTWVTNPGSATLYFGQSYCAGNNEPLNYATRPSAIIRRRITSGTQDSLFATVTEPLNGGVGNITAVTQLPMTGNALDSAAIQITFSSGRVDTILVNMYNPSVAGVTSGSTTISTADGQYSLTGRIGEWMSQSGNDHTWTMGASSFSYPGHLFTPATTCYYSGSITGETRIATGGTNNAFISSVPLPTGTALQGKYLSLIHPSLNGYGVTGISELFPIDHVEVDSGAYNVCFPRDHQYVINGTTSTEQVLPERTFTGTNNFEIVESAFALNLAPYNVAPVLGTLSNQSVAIGGSVNFTATATDANSGQTLTFSLGSGAPAGAYINPTTGAFSWTPTAVGNYTVPVTVTDNGTPPLHATQIITVTVTGTTNVPTGETTQDIGSVGFTGSDSQTGDVTELNGSGADIYGGADAFRFESQPVTGDTTVVTKVTSVSYANGWSKAGAMIRETTAAGATEAAMVVTPGEGVSFQWRSTTGGSTGDVSHSGVAAPYWVKLTRVGNVFSGYYSPDGVTWTQLGTSQTISMATNAYAGLCVTSHDNTQICAATFTNTSVQNVPSPWTAADVGAVGVTGSATVPSTGLFQLIGSGAGIGGSADAFTSVTQTESSNCTIIAKVESIQNTNAGAGAGIMVRQSTAAGSYYASLMVTPSNGVVAQWRAAGGSAGTSTVGGITAPIWLKLVYSSGGAYSYRSTNGTSWTQISSRSVGMSGNFMVGLVTTSTNNAVNTTGTIDNISITNP